VGTNAAFLREVAKLPVYAACDAGVLVLGETGTGKEVFAQAVHRLSARAARPWVTVNCGALPTELVESKLFGHAKGAFTTAPACRAGLVSEAEGGTLFLDDVDCLPPLAQVNLLRFLQEREYRPVGAAGVRRADVRVIAAPTCTSGSTCCCFSCRRCAIAATTSPRWRCTSCAASPRSTGGACAGSRPGR
jgi:two-component system response regulator GlrR